MQALLEVLSNLQNHVAPPLWTGVDLLSHLQRHTRLLPTGCERYVTFSLYLITCALSATATTSAAHLHHVIDMQRG